MKKSIVSSQPTRRSLRVQKLPPEFAPTINVVHQVPPLHFAAYFISAGLLSFPYFPHINLAKNSNDKDTLTFQQAMNDKDKDKWIISAKKEIDELEAHNAWEEVPYSQLGNEKLVPTTWVFQKKRAPDGTIKKFKGRLCVRGDLMKGSFDTFSPVVSFSTVRLFLILSLMLCWNTCTLDFSNAFIQAERNKPIFIHTPQGFKTKPGFVLKLIRSLYGAKDAPKLWCDHLFRALRKFGFVQSKFDPCLWFKSTMFIIIFVDDCGLCFKEESLVSDFLSFLDKEGFKYTKESTFAEFLGIKYEKDLNGNVHLTQTGLINKILDVTGMTQCNTNKLPSAREPLGLDENGDPMNEKWDYASVVGMLLYLSTNTRPDISFAVSQVARFTYNPKQSHVTAIKTILRYLKGTSTQGTIVKKATSLSLSCFCDADFAGLYKRDPDSMSSSAKSRSGYILKLAGCPLVWKSQLQSTIALSTAESEYCALSSAMRTLIPIRLLVCEMVDKIALPPSLKSTDTFFIATVYSDNTSAVTLTTEQRLTSRTRHYHVRFHHF